MDVSTLNLPAVFVAALLAFSVGMPWYGPLFGKAWLRAVGITPDDTKKVNMGRIFGTSFVLHLFMAFCLAMFLNDPSIGAGEGAFYGFLTGFGWIAPVIVVNALFEQRPPAYMAITGGHWIVAFTIMGAVLGAWR